MKFNGYNTKESINIEYIGRDAIIDTPDSIHIISETPRVLYKFKIQQWFLDWDNQSSFIGDYRVHPYKSNNDLPDIVSRKEENICSWYQGRRRRNLFGV
jgi:hypothetical protein